MFPSPPPYMSPMQYILVDPMSQAAKNDLFDWKQSDALDITQIDYTKRNKKTLTFLKDFVHARSFQNGTFEQFVHLLTLLQESIKSMSAQQAHLVKKVRVLKDKNTSLKATLNNKKDSDFLCPICQKAKPNINNLDRHINNKHKAYADSWLRIRTPEDKLEQLKKQTDAAMIKEMHHWMEEKFQSIEKMVLNGKSLPPKSKKRTNSPKKKHKPVPKNNVKALSYLTQEYFEAPPQINQNTKRKHKEESSDSESDYEHARFIISPPKRPKSHQAKFKT